MKKIFLICLVVMLIGCQKSSETQHKSIAGNLYRISNTHYEIRNEKWELRPIGEDLLGEEQVHWLIEENGVRKYTYFPLSALSQGGVALYDIHPESYYFKPDYTKDIVETNIFGTEQTVFLLHVSNEMGFILRYYPEKDSMIEINMILTDFTSVFEDALPDTPENRELV